MSNIVIVGATGGIGQSLVEILLDKNHTVIAIGRDNNKLQELQTKFTAIKTFVGETANFEQFANLINTIKQEYTEINGIVNLAGSIFLKPAHLTTESEFQQVVSTNLQTAFSVVRAAGMHLSDHGSVVLLSTAAALIGIANHEAIVAAKAGLSALAKSASATYINKHLRFNVVAPGMTKTPLSAKLLSNDLAVKASTLMHPLGRLGEPADIASMITWLLAPENSWIVGQTIAIDGGLANIRNKVKS